MQRSIRGFSFVLGAASAALIFTGFASAEEVARVGVEPAKIEISYADLNLSQTDNAVELYTRIERAARNVCHIAAGPDAHALMLERRCVAKAMGDAVQDVGNANLTAVYFAKSGKRSMVASSR